MKWMYGIVLVFSLLTIYFIYEEYKKKTFPKKTFMIVAAMEVIVALFSGILLLV